MARGDVLIITGVKKDGAAKTRHLTFITFVVMRQLELHAELEPQPLAYRGR
jgi:hypothetical protein